MVLNLLKNDVKSNAKLYAERFNILHEFHKEELKQLIE